MEDNHKQAEAVPLDAEAADAFLPIRRRQSAATFRRNPDADAAMQYLIWALEEMEKTGSRKKAVRHARAAIAELRKDR